MTFWFSRLCQKLWILSGENNLIFISMKKEAESLISLHGTETLGKGMTLLAGLCNLVFLDHPRQDELCCKSGIIIDLDCFEARDLIMVRQCLGELKNRFEDWPVGGSFDHLMDRLSEFDIQKFSPDVRNIVHKSYESWERGISFDIRYLKGTKNIFKVCKVIWDNITFHKAYCDCKMHCFIQLPAR